MEPVTPKLLEQLRDLRQRLPHNGRVVAMRHKNWIGHQRMDVQLRRLEESIRKLSERQIDPALEVLNGFEYWNLKYSMDRWTWRREDTPSWLQKPLKWWNRERIEILEFASNRIREMIEELEGEKHSIPQPIAVRYLPPAPDVPFDSSPPPDWLAMFVPSQVLSICIEEHNARCDICYVDFEPPRLAEEDSETDDENNKDDSDTLLQLPCQHVLHEECLNLIDGNLCPVCRTQSRDRPDLDNAGDD
ncbi:hypothetical protein D9758_008098 [Tetrapyrgos nigripes]|uniref:RING-type domain-containing protein n=1 Tax=Tetrapyrgos nigripes TaxID=182062 RepID=A0A8H5GH93_9AGAR|nr:hypothetical protein D9758_008098 [Tetrapyrgos nigripes]